MSYCMTGKRAKVEVSLVKLLLLVALLLYDLEKLCCKIITVAYYKMVKYAKKKQKTNKRD